MASPSDPNKLPTSATNHIARTGLTVLACPPRDEDCLVDIVFVHGLQGHPKNTWSTQSRQPGHESLDSDDGQSNLAKLQGLFSRKRKRAESQPDNPSHVFWPQDLLPQDCVSARILTFGYDSDVSKFFDGAVNRNNFYDHANDLLRALLRERSRVARQRPIIFVAHSLGGIVVKQALVDSQRAERRIEEKSVYYHTEAVVFLGTPHRGSQYSSWGQIAERIARAAIFDTNKTTLSHLQVHGLELANLERDFLVLLDRRTFSVFNFQEALGLKGIKGFNGKVVENWSSSIGDHGSEPSESINANHMNMCRFYGRDDPGYKQVGGEIQIKVDELVQKHQEALSNEHADFLKSLLGCVSEETFTGIDIKDPLENTCEWILRRHSFSEWVREGDGIYWINGNPGTGKSTLMKYLLADHEGLLQKHIPSSSRLVKTGFFFRRTRSWPERTANSMLRTILAQLFQREKRVYQKSLPTLRAMKSPHRTAEHMKWSDQQLGSVFDDICQGQRDESAPLRLLMFLDAVDESLDREMEAVVSSLRRLLSTARKHSVLLGICITSRPLPELRREADLACGCISLQRENHEAIYTYIESELASRRDDRRGEDYYSRFAEKVAERADGVFLWVALVVPRLRRKIDHGGTIRELEALLQDIPNDLKKLFIDILQRIPGPDLGMTMRILQIATLVRRRLTLEEFQHALAFQPGSPYKSLEAWKRSSDFLELGEMLIARLQYHSGGLLELHEELDIEIDPVTQYREFLRKFSPQPLLYKFLPPSTLDNPPGSLPRRSNISLRFRSSAGRWSSAKRWSKPTPHVPVVRFIHETAKHFFRENEGFNILYDLIPASEAAKATPNPFCSPRGCYLTGGHQFIVNSCASYLSIQELRPKVTEMLTSSTRPRVGEFHFLQYISESWFHHIHEAEEGGLAQTDILRWLLFLQPSALNQCICWAGEHDIRSWIRLCIEHKVDVNVVDATLLSYGRPIRRAVANGFYEAARLLIQAGANVNGITGGLETTLRVSERMMNQEIAELLRKNKGVLWQPHWIPPEGQIVKLVSLYMYEFRRAGEEKRDRDVLPLYYAAFLFHAAAACAQGENALLYLNLAEHAFSLLDAHTTKFPLGMQRHKQDDLQKCNWGVRLTLKHNKSDNSMDVGPYFFVLAEARKKHDQEEQRMM